MYTRNIKLLALYMLSIKHSETMKESRCCAVIQTCLTQLWSVCIQWLLKILSVLWVVPHVSAVSLFSHQGVMFLSSLLAISFITFKTYLLEHHNISFWLSDILAFLDLTYRTSQNLAVFSTCLLKHLPSEEQYLNKNSHITIHLILVIYT